MDGMGGGPGGGGKRRQGKQRRQASHAGDVSFSEMYLGGGLGDGFGPIMDQVRMKVWTKCE